MANLGFLDLLLCYVNTIILTRVRLLTFWKSNMYKILQKCLIVGINVEEDVRNDTSIRVADFLGLFLKSHLFQFDMDAAK